MAIKKKKKKKQRDYITTFKVIKEINQRPRNKPKTRSVENSQIYRKTGKQSFS